MCTFNSEKFMLGSSKKDRENSASHCFIQSYEGEREEERERERKREGGREGREGGRGGEIERTICRNVGTVI